MFALTDKCPERAGLESAILDDDLLPRVVAEEQPRVEVIRRKATLGFVGGREVWNNVNMIEGPLEGQAAFVRGEGEAEHKHDRSHQN